ncbi:MAG: DUF4138 domain-containing protein [Muricauda sp.]|nr:DUF4138 domain-containing protein [Allomuricauda sp.]MBA4745928.1 DUF4138 domain-containing protein [Allomuricauda sp.]
MKNTIFILWMLLAVASQAANSTTLDTIYANEHMNMALFFPSKIKQGIVGNDNFAFTYNREKGQTLGLLKAVPGKDSNLLVITEDGSVYSYLVRYAREISYPNRFIGLEERIGSEDQGVGEDVQQERVAQTLVADSSEVPTISDRRFQASCESLLQLPERKHSVKKEQGLSLAVTNMVYMDNEVYVQFEIDNHSGVRFDFGDLELFKVSGKRGRRSSYQELELQPRYRHNVPTSIMHGQKSRLFYVFPKFHLDKGEKLRANLTEEGTSRLVALTFK